MADSDMREMSKERESKQNRQGFRDDQPKNKTVVNLRYTETKSKMEDSNYEMNISEYQHLLNESPNNEKKKVNQSERNIDEAAALRELGRIS